ncbi:MAG TPA: hypothetical protein VMN38_10475 [Sphingomicrobium sp.]|nr:hypothetical protein [Sphingomicrobium sp.]
MAGQEYEIRNSYETAERTSDGSSSGSSRGHTTIIERVLAVRDGGWELEYDFPKETTAEDRAREWQLPARVFKPSSGPIQLLNRAELETRIDRWLKKAEWPRSVCGRWIFTWNAFRIECDPQTAIEMIEGYDLGHGELRQGAAFELPEARGAGTLVLQRAGPTGSTFSVLLKVDPEAIQRARAESDIAVGEIMQKPVTLEAALRERAMETVSGTISVTLETDPAGRPWRRTSVTKVDIKMADGSIESKTSTRTLEKRLVSGQSTALE